MIVIYLVVLLLNDLFVFYFGLFWYWIIKLFDVDVWFLSELSCKLYFWVVYMLFDIFGWILVVVIIEWVVLVWFLYVSKVWCNRIVVVCILGVFIGSIMLINLYLIYGIGDVINIENNEIVVKYCYYESDSYKRFFIDIWFWIDLVKFNVVLFLFILIGNVIIIISVVKNY